MSKISIIALTRYAALAIGVFSGLVVVGGFMIGLSQGDGRFLAVACMFSGAVLTTCLWWSMAAHVQENVNLDLVALISFVASAGFALYSNLAYLLWFFGFPMSIGTVENGKMPEVYWLPPVTLLYAVFAWVCLQYVTSKNR
jgi:hypothetical protein